MDCGTASPAEIAQLQGSGVDVIVVDHHEGKTEPPRCIAVVKSEARQRLSVSLYCRPCLQSCARTLKRRPLPGFDLREMLDLVALGTVADLVPLTGENRILVKRGLVQIANSRWVGVRTLVAGVWTEASLCSGGCGFWTRAKAQCSRPLWATAQECDWSSCSPKMRVGRGPWLWDSISRIGSGRAVEESVYQEAEAELATWFDPATHAAIVVGKRGWHPGVIGIAASRLQKRHHRPTIVIGFDDTGLGKGQRTKYRGASH
jgi:single-stranded-DNA-specific exonuclease